MLCGVECGVRTFEEADHLVCAGSNSPSQAGLK